MTGHALLETARDALFLARLPPERLPWVYLAIAAIAFGLFAWQQSSGRAQQNRAGLAVSLYVSAGVTLGFWFLSSQSSTWVLYALYAWTGVFATLVIVRFWILAGDLFTVSQAKRLFAFVGSGASVGAISGAALARIVAELFPPQHLLLAASAALLLTAVGPLMQLPRPESVPSGLAPVPGGIRVELMRSLKPVWERPYLRLVAGIGFISTVAVTLVDYIFKSTVAAKVAADDLGAFFAGTYLLLNVLGLLAQLFLVGPMMQKLGVSRVLSVLPALLLFGGLGVAVGGGLFAAMLLKAFDGSLRHSLHRTATEVLFVPLPGELRSRVKGLIDVAGQRGGQAFASVAILLVVSWDSGAGLLAGGVILLAAAWAYLAANLQRHYVALFRESLSEVMLQTRVAFPELDLASLEALMTTLNHPNDDKVVAAIDMLEEQDRVRLIPALILYHPSAAVVVRALELFTRAGREDFLPVTDRLLEHPAPEVRAATLRTLAWMAPDPALYDRFVRDDSPIVRSTALVGQVSFGGPPAESAAAAMRALAESGSLDERLSLARAIRYSPGAVFEELLLKLASGAEERVLLAVARAMREILSPRFVPPLLRMLSKRELRNEARRTLVAIGRTALEELDRSLDDPQLDLRIRRQLPRAIGDFEPSAAAVVLMKHFSDERDGGVRYRLLRALGRLKDRHPDVDLDLQVFNDAAEDTLATVFVLMNWRVHLETGTAQVPERATDVQELMTALLDHRQRLALQRLFRLLSLLHPGDDLRSIYRGVHSSKRDVRASSRELLETLIQPPMRDPLLALVDELPDADKLERAGRYLPPARGEYELVLTALLERSSTAMRCLVAYHAAELRLVELRPAIGRMREGAPEMLERVIARALAMLEERPQGSPDGK